MAHKIFPKTETKDLDDMFQPMPSLSFYSYRLNYLYSARSVVIDNIPRPISSPVKPLILKSSMLKTARNNPLTNIIMSSVHDKKFNDRITPKY